MYSGGRRPSPGLGSAGAAEYGGGLPGGEALYGGGGGSAGPCGEEGGRKRVRVSARAAAALDARAPVVRPARLPRPDARWTGSAEASPGAAGAAVTAGAAGAAGTGSPVGGAGAAAATGRAGRGADAAGGVRGATGRGAPETEGGAGRRRGTAFVAERWTAGGLGPAPPVAGRGGGAGGVRGAAAVVIVGALRRGVGEDTGRGEGAAGEGTAGEGCGAAKGGVVVKGGCAVNGGDAGLAAVVTGVPPGAVARWTGGVVRGSVATGTGAAAGRREAEGAVPAGGREAPSAEGRCAGGVAGAAAGRTALAGPEEVGAPSPGRRGAALRCTGWTGAAGEPLVPGRLLAGRWV